MNMALKATAATLCAIGGLIAFASSARAAENERSSPRIAEINHRPRSTRGPAHHVRSPGGQVYKEFHGGFQEPDGDPEAQVLFGARLGALVDRHLAIGGMLDWSHRGETITEVVSSSPGPGGTTITTQQEFARASADLVPMLGFLQFSGNSNMSLVPYAGVGGGYELLFLSAEDFTTGDRYDATFGGWGWQAWGGLAIPLSSQARLGAEVFRNFGDLTRDTEDSSGATTREKVNVDAMGMRFGISFGF